MSRREWMEKVNTALDGGRYVEVLGAPEELRRAARELAPLLADSHPARDVVRNLFRLDRLVRQSSSDPAPHTEAEMAKQWWQTGDGKKDD